MKKLLMLLLLLITHVQGQGCSYLVHDSNISYELVFLDGTYKLYVTHFSYYQDQIAYSGELIFNEDITIIIDDEIISKPIQLIFYGRELGYWTERISTVLTEEEITKFLTADNVRVILNGYNARLFNSTPKPILHNLQGGFSFQCGIE